MSDAELILHIGAPKCGSSALQTALTMRPNLTTNGGRNLRYMAAMKLPWKVKPVRGRRLSWLGQRSAYGYVSCPNLSPRLSPKELWPVLSRVRKAGRRGGFVPVLSNEGWIHHHGQFSGLLAEWGNPPVEVLAYLRPPIEWFNAAYWQWGVWHAPDMDTWLRHADRAFSFGEDLEAWAAIPGVRLRVAPFRPDVVSRFAAQQGVNLAAPSRNLSSPPSLVGVLRRTRKLRPSGHAAAIEFVFQRWCPSVPGRRLWGLMPRHVHLIRPVAARNWSALQRCLPPEVCAKLAAEAGWSKESYYHQTILSGASPLDDPDEAMALDVALRQGIEAAAAAARRPTRGLPSPISQTDTLEARDRVLLELLERLQALDRQTRRRGALRQYFLPAPSQ